MKRNKFLDDLGIKPENYGINFCHKNDDSDNKRWNKQRKKYGFDGRECYNLDHTYVEWLYSHLMMYKKEASIHIDLNFHKFEHKGKTYTQKEAINYILKRLRRYLKYDFVNRSDEKAVKDVKEATLMWAKIFSAMWW